MSYDYKKLTPFKRCVLQSFPFIEADFDALTNYQLLSKVVEYLNKVINSQNTVTENIEVLNKWFENLDVQDEVNNKLDAMAESGQLAEIINQEIFGELNEKINASVKFAEKEDNTNIDGKFKSINITTDSTEDNLIYIIKLDNIDKVALVPTSGNTTNPEVGVKSIYNCAKTNDNYDLFINAGVYGGSYKPVGYCVFDGLTYTNTGTPDYYVGFDSNKKLKATPSSQVGSAQALVDMGYTSACGTFAPVMLNGVAVDVSGLSDPVYTEKHPRQLLLQDTSDNVYIMSILGRNPYTSGMSYAEIVTYLQGKDIKTCINLDGGGSVQTVFNKKSLFTTQDPGSIYGRIVCNGFAFKLGGNI